MRHREPVHESSSERRVRESERWTAKIHQPTGTTQDTSVLHNGHLGNTLLNPSVSQPLSAANSAASTAACAADTTRETSSGSSSAAATAATAPPRAAVTAAATTAAVSCAVVAPLPRSSAARSALSPASDATRFTSWSAIMANVPARQAWQIQCIHGCIQNQARGAAVDGLRCSRHSSAVQAQQSLPPNARFDLAATFPRRSISSLMRRSIRFTHQTGENLSPSCSPCTSLTCRGEAPSPRAGNVCSKVAQGVGARPCARGSPRPALGPLETVQLLCDMP
mmetsp:Transcript_8746/g.25908  ORF Transcript_8746/g.25908 Transcript_8746/m.25908 type:complete len:280 (+) Transcript_8746:136-975(+)